METKMSQTTLGYNRDSSSSSPTPPPPQVHTLVFNNPPQNSHPNHNTTTNLYPPPHLAPSSQRPVIDPDLTAATTTTTNTSTITTQPQPQQITSTTTTTKICYRECLRNHAASMGSHVVDGCGEFMPSGEEGTPQYFKCAACDCHRNFHRKHIQQQHSIPQQHVQHVPNYHHSNNNGHLNLPTPSSSSQRVSQPSSGQVPPSMMMTFGSVPAESSSEDLNMFGAQFSIQTPQQPVLKKRVRTKFSQQQKDRMMEFAEKIGWKIQKHDEQEVQQFCSQVGIKRQVFKVFMHNNKQAMKKQQM